MENSIEELKQRLDELYRIQQARLDAGADDLDIREEISEVEETIKDLQDETNVDRENSIKNERSSIKEDIERLKLCSTNQCNICGRYEKEECMLERNRCEQHILSDYKKVLKENEELKNQEATARRINELLVQRYSNSIPVQKVKDKIEELQKEYNKLDKQVDEYIKSAEKDVSTYYENKERISIIQTLSYFIGILQELLESEE